jgi:hypothetical protein
LPAVGTKNEVELRCEYVSVVEERTKPKAAGIPVFDSAQR